jgi:drug/metabolite transporter (DMT)-like permease
MKNRKSRWRVISISGYVVLGVGVLGMIWDFSTRGPDPHVFDLGLVVANAAIIFLGLFATAIAQSLRDLEERLNEIESLRKHNAP